MNFLVQLGTSTDFGEKKPRKTKQNKTQDFMWDRNLVNSWSPKKGGLDKTLRGQLAQGRITLSKLMPKVSLSNATSLVWKVKQHF